MTKADVPVVIEEEAARRIARLQIHEEMGLMIDWVRDNVPELRGIHIASLRSASSPDEIVMWAHDAGTPWASVPESPDYRFITWRFSRFPVEVGWKVSMWTTHLPMPQTAREGEPIGAVLR
jgi:hypothetical protein